MANKLYDIGQNEQPIMPTKPLLIIKDQTVWEAESVEDAITIVLGEKYLLLDEKEKWNERAQRARMEVLMGLGRNQNLQVMHSKLGVIRLNYASEQDEEFESFKGNKIDIMIDNDKAFLLSLVRIGVLVILENVNSSIFQENIQENVSQNKFIALHEKYDIDELIRRNL